MENTKAKKVLLIILIVLLLVCLSVIIFQYITFNKLKNANTNTTSKEQETVKSEITKKDDEKIETPKEYTVNDLISETKKELEKEFDGKNYKYNSVMPQIKLNKENANKINQEIKKSYDIFEESFKAKAFNTNIKYSAKIENNILVITIIDSYIDWVGTGIPESSSEKVYKYDYINDKRVYTKANDLIDDLKFLLNPISHSDGHDNEYELDMVLPQFMIKTNATQQINDKVVDLYDKYLDAYRNDEDNELNTRNTNISYKTDMNNESGVLTLNISIVYTNSKNKKLGSENITYKYDYVNDKVLS